MGQFSMEIKRPNGSLLGGNQQVVGSTGQRNGSFEGISRRLEAKRFPWPCIEPKGDLIEVMLCVYG